MTISLATAPSIHRCPSYGIHLSEKLHAAIIAWFSCPSYLQRLGKLPHLSIIEQSHIIASDLFPFCIAASYNLLKYKLSLLVRHQFNCYKLV